MTEFKVGDLVRFIDPGCSDNFEARRVQRTLGTVVEVELDDGFNLIKVDWRDGLGFESGFGWSSKNHLEYAFKSTPVNASKIPSFLVHEDYAQARVLYPLVSEGRAVRDAGGGGVFYVSGDNTTMDQDVELAQFFADAINEKIERDK